MSAKGTDLFYGQIFPDFGLLGGSFYPSKSVVENKCLIEHPGTHYGILKTVVSKSGIVWLAVPRNQFFILNDGFYGCLR